MEGATLMDYAANRKALGMSRQEIADLAGVTVGAVASIEGGRGSRDKGAEDKIRTTLEQLIAPSTKTDGERGTPAAYREKNLQRYEALHPTWIVEYEYMGLTPESRFTVEGEEGVFVFVRIVTNDHGSTWVDCYGGERNCPEHARSFPPERVNPM